jgi:hypothetical protein
MDFALTADPNGQCVEPDANCIAKRRECGNYGYRDQCGCDGIFRKLKTCFIQ